MTSPSNQAPLRTTSLALAFQEVFTVVLRTRFAVQRWDTAERMRGAVKPMIAGAAQTVRNLGYSDEITQMALYAIVAFVDENVLNSRDPVFQNWAGFTLQQEMFGSQIAGEIFFRHLADLLNRPDSSDVADMLELHGLCLLLGFRGRFAAGDASEIDAINRRIRDKIQRIRGPFVMVRATSAPVVPPAPTSDSWVKNLTLAVAGIAAVCLLAYLGFLLILIQGVPATQHAVLVTAPTHQSAEVSL
jgi:type VI secretion system protein ImpK